MQRYELKSATEIKPCYTCGGGSFSRLNRPNSKWICIRCHPPGPGLDVICSDHETATLNDGRRLAQQIR